MHQKYTKTTIRMGVFLLIAMIFSLFCAPTALAAESADLTLTEGVTTSTEVANPPTEATPPAAEEAIGIEPIAGMIADFFREESAGILSCRKIRKSVTVFSSV